MQTSNLLLITYKGNPTKILNQWDIFCKWWLTSLIKCLLLLIHYICGIMCFPKMLSFWNLKGWSRPNFGQKVYRTKYNDQTEKARFNMNKCSLYFCSSCKNSSKIDGCLSSFIENYNLDVCTWKTDNRL